MEYKNWWEWVKSLTGSRELKLAKLLIREVQKMLWVRSIFIFVEKVPEVKKLRCMAP